MHKKLMNMKYQEYMDLKDSYARTAYASRTSDVVNICLIDDSVEFIRLFQQKMGRFSNVTLQVYVDEVDFLNDLFANRIVDPHLLLIDINLKQIPGNNLSQMISDLLPKTCRPVLISASDLHSYAKDKFFIKKPISNVHIDKLMELVKAA